MIVFRLSRTKYKNDLSGKGAEIAGGRWNSIGNALLYTSSNRALCTTEIAVHTPLGIVPIDYHLISIDVPDVVVEKLDASTLPENWKSSPHQEYTKTFGNDFVKRNESLILRVPSAIVQGEYNYLINPNHNQFKEVKILKTELFKFDKRLFDR